jgi:ABC-type amino acid transport substrate-binding protein
VILFQISSIFSVIIFASLSSANEFNFSTLNFDSPSINHCINVIEKPYKSIGHDTNISRLPSRRALNWSLLGKNDGEVCRFDGFDVEKKLIKIKTPIMMVQLYAYSNKNIGPINSLEDLKKISIGVINGTSYAGQLANTKVLKLTNLKNISTLFKMLNANRIDIAVIFSIEAKEYTSSYKHSTSLEKIFPPKGLYHFINKRHRNLASEIDKAIAMYK